MNTREINRIVNLRYKIYKYNFDAAIDCNFVLHCYEYSSDEKPKIIPIELYNLNGDWDVKVIACTTKDFSKINEKATINEPNSVLCHTFVPFEFIIEETKRWITENNRWYGFWYRLFRFFKSPLKKH